LAKKRKGTAVLQLFFIVISLICLATATYYASNYLNKPRFIRYPAFGIDIPINYSVHGIDVSHHQAKIDWDEVKAMKVGNIQLQFCFMKATEGIESIDGRFRRNWYEAKAAGMPRGAYHFFNAGKSGKEQAKNYITNVDLEQGDFPPVLDVEQIGRTSVKQLQERVAEWLQLVEAKYGVKPIIYTNADFYENYLADKFDAYPLWVAHYLVKAKPRIKRPWHFWQHNERGRVNGIDAYVDFNVFNGALSDLKKLQIK
jgi:lysozyme